MQVPTIEEDPTTSSEHRMNAKLLQLKKYNNFLTKVSSRQSSLPADFYYFMDNLSKEKISVF